MNNHLTLLTLPLTKPALYVLVGAGGSGKSSITTAFPPSWSLSLDTCRAQVADNAGSQAATPAAVRVFDAALDGRLSHHLPTVIDNTSTEQKHRTRLIKRAHHYGMLAVAIAVRTPLSVCQARQALRPASLQVPRDVIERQHDGVPSAEQLLSEGFDQAHDADRLDLMRLLLERSASADFDPLVDIRATFGPDLAAVFAFTDSDDSRGTFAVAGRTITVRWSDDGEPFDHHWQAQTEGHTCSDCGRALWVRVASATDLLHVYTGKTGKVADEPLCLVCDAPDYAA
ncbi:AAA family ATPase [Streptomyces botrytidirepellens]|uniref:ATP-binding protein n=1 Tax=Streptomyces botrytidirepellens TaxID=2486417 RepID=A0A3M8WA17_9ACTN|nr:AAA family ATPase [Streptomyces botrytidirepellens]RNG26377.1 ATP-binding protein [Streptomyces botrytidirepellens]